jgi:hypothetical protein
MGWHELNLRIGQPQFPRNCHLYKPEMQASQARAYKPETQASVFEDGDSLAGASGLYENDPGSVQLASVGNFQRLSRGANVAPMSPQGGIGAHPISNRWGSDSRPSVLSWVSLEFRHKSILTDGDRPVFVRQEFP